MDGLHTLGYSLVPQRDRLQQCCHYPSGMQAFSRIPSTSAGVDQIPVRVCLSNPLHGIPSTPVATYHMTQGTDPCDSEVWTGG
jgi:hypothetical protein